MLHTGPHLRPMFLTANEFDKYAEACINGRLDRVVPKRYNYPYER